MQYEQAARLILMTLPAVWSSTVNPEDKYESLINRVWLIASIKQEKTGHLTYGELKRKNQLSKTVLSDHLKFLVMHGWLLTKGGVYWLDPKCEDDLKRIDSNLVGYLGYEMKEHGRRAFNRLRRKKKLKGFYKYDEEITRFEAEAHKLGRKLA